jgi:hypothetical protein
MKKIRPVLRFECARFLREIAAGLFILALAFNAFQIISVEAQPLAGGTGATGIELTDQHPESHPHEPGSGHRSGTCCSAACASTAMAQGGSSYFRFPSPKAAGFTPIESTLHGIVLAGDPPVPRFGSS